MADMGWNPWKLTAIGLALVVATALVTGIVVAYWTGRGPDRSTGAPAEVSKPGPAPAAGTPPPPRAAPPTPPPVVTAPVAPAVPTRAAIDACNRYAAEQAGSGDKTTEVVKDTAIGTLVGAAIGAAGGAIAGGGKGAGKGAAIGSVVGVGGGVLYGLNENKQHDQRYRDAYANCLRSRGYKVEARTRKFESGA
jgi:hypothetical protein